MAKYLYQILKIYNIKTKSTELFLSELLLPKPNSWNASFSGNNIPTLIVVELHNGKGFDDDSLCQSQSPTCTSDVSVNINCALKSGAKKKCKELLRNFCQG